MTTSQPDPLLFLPGRRCVVDEVKDYDGEAPRRVLEKMSLPAEMSRGLLQSHRSLGQVINTYVCQPPTSRAQGLPIFSSEPVPPPNAPSAILLCPSWSIWYSCSRTIWQQQKCLGNVMFVFQASRSRHSPCEVVLIRIADRQISSRTSPSPSGTRRVGIGPETVQQGRPLENLRVESCVVLVPGCT